MSIALPESLWEMVEPLGWVLVHFVWQGILIGIGLACALAAMRQGSAKGRYCASLLALGGMGVMPFVTLSIPALSRPIPAQERIAEVTVQPPVEMREVEEPIAEVATKEFDVEDSGIELESDVPMEGRGEFEEVAAGVPPTVETKLGAEMKSVGLMERIAETAMRLRPWLKMLVAFWLAGVLLLSIRLVRMWNRVQRLRCVGVEEVPDPLVSRLEELARRLGLRMRVNFLLSQLVEVPTLIGWLRPVILLPAAAVTGLTPSQLDAILVHELAHIRRHDYLVNLMQSAVETLLFYHPAVWWVSGRLRAERENCCDDLTVEILGDPINYGRALLVLEEQRGASTNPALVLGSQGGSLLGRIERLVVRSNGRGRSTMGTSMSVLVGMLMLSCATMLMVRGEISEEKFIESTEDKREQENENDGEIPERIVHRFEMIYFQDQDRRTIPAVTFRLGDEFYSVMSAPATIPSDGVDAAIDRMFMRFHKGIDYNPRYQKKKSTMEIFIYQTSSIFGDIPSLRPDQVTELVIGDRVSVAEIGEEKEIIQTINAARVSGVGKNAKIVYHDGKDSHLFENLTELDRRYMEGTAVFSNGKLGGFVVAGERFLPQGENRSLIVPADRIVSAIQSLLGPNRQERAGQTLAEHKADDDVVVRMTPVSGQLNLLLDGEISLNLDGVPLEQGLREIFGEGQILIEIDEESLKDQMISTKQPVTIQLVKIRRRTALSLMLEQARLTWDVRDGTIFITTPSAKSNRLVLKTFPVSDLLTPSDSKPGESLVGLLTNTVAPHSWDENGGNGRIEFNLKRESLVVRQSSENLAEVERSLEELRSYVLVNRPITISFEAIPLREAVERLSKLTGARLYLDPVGLDEVGVKPDVPVTLDAKDLRFHAALMQILEPLHLAYRKEAADEVVRITSASRAKGKISTRTYEGFGDLQELKKVIEKTIDPESWDRVGGEGRIEPVELTRTLVIRQSEDVHDQIRKLLDELLREKLKSLPQGPYREEEEKKSIEEETKAKGDVSEKPQIDEAKKVSVLDAKDEKPDVGGDGKVGVAAAGLTAETVVARVGDTEIRAREVLEAIAPQLKQLRLSVERLRKTSSESQYTDLLKQVRQIQEDQIKKRLPDMVEIRLLSLAMTDHLRTLDESQVLEFNKSIDEFLNYSLDRIQRDCKLASREEVESRLINEGYDFHVFCEQQREAFLANAFHSQRYLRLNEPTAEKIRAYYDSNLSRYTQAERIVWEAIQFVSERDGKLELPQDLVRQIRSDFEKGRPVDEIVKKHPALIQSISKEDDKKPDLESFSDPNLTRILTELPIGGVSELRPILGDLQFVRVVNRLPAYVTPFEQCKGEIAELLKKQEAEIEYDKLIEELRGKYPVWTIVNGHPHRKRIESWSWAGMPPTGPVIVWLFSEGDTGLYRSARSRELR